MLYLIQLSFDFVLITSRTKAANLSIQNYNI